KKMIGRFLSVAVALLIVGAISARGEEVRPAMRVVQDGVTIDLRLQPRGAIEGENATFGFSLTDAQTATPLTGSRPAAWMHSWSIQDAADTQGCAKRAAPFLAGSILTKPAIDLNSYYVLSLNSDETITVVDPLFGFGGTKLLAMVFLSSPGEDWALTSDQDRLFVSMPAAGAVAVVDTSNWKVSRTIPVGTRPGRLVLQPDEKYGWVAYERMAASGGPGVAALAPDGTSIAARVATGGRPSALAFSSDSQYLFVTSAEHGSVLVIDTRTLKRVASIAVGGKPSSIDYSPLSQLAYVADGETGTIFAVSSTRRRVVARIPVEKGVSQVRIAPKGRLGFAVNPEKDLVQLFDVAVGRVIQTADITKGPDQVTFSDKLAYIRRRASEEVIMMPLEQVGNENAAVPIVNFPGGQRPLCQSAKPSPADSILQAPGANAVLVANFADRAIYYYREGMAAPMGSFENYGKSPRAVLAVDRSLREHAPGVYESTQHLPAAGNYEVIFFLDSPRVVQCFQLTI